MNGLPEDPFAILGLPRDAGLPAIRQQFKILALKYHPDKTNGSSSAQFKRVYDAYLAALRLSEEATAVSGGGEPHSDFVIARVGDEVESTLFEWSDEAEQFQYECRCGGVYALHEQERTQGVNVVGCTNCGLYIRIV